MTDYRQDWRCEPYPASAAVVRWLRACSWGKGLLFERAPACKLLVTQEASATLDAFLEVAKFCDDLVDRWVSSREIAKWSDTLAKEAIAAGLRALKEGGLPEQGPQWRSGERALVRATQRCAMDLRQTGRLRARTKDRFVPTCRLPIGLHYDLPILTKETRDGARWLYAPILGVIGVVAVRKQPFLPDQAAYCEATPLSDGWWIRFVKATKRPDEDGKPNEMWTEEERR